MSGLISGIGGTIVAAVATKSLYEANGDTNRLTEMFAIHWLQYILTFISKHSRLYAFYPSRIPVFNSTEYISLNLSSTHYRDGGDGRSASAQAGYQIAVIIFF